MPTTESAAPDRSQKAIFFFWMPLAATWLMMAVEGPYLAAVIARLADPIVGLAAYGVAMAFAVLVEAPVIMLMSAATALVADAVSYRRMRAFANGLNVLSTALLLLVLVPPIHDVVFTALLGLPRDVADLTYGALWCFLPWPASIGYRRFLQGVMIRAGRTRLVAYGTVIRLGAMSVGALLYGFVWELPGPWVGAAALSTGVIVEAIAARVMARGSIRELLVPGPGAGAAPRAGTAEPPRAADARAPSGPREPADARALTGPPRPGDATKRDAPVAGPPGPDLEYRDIASFYYPLALTSLLGLAVGPMVTFFMGRSVSPVESLAVFPVVHSLLFIFRALGLSFQDTAIALLGTGRDGYPELAKFAHRLGAALSLVLAAIAFTPLADFWFRTVSGLTAELTAFALPATRIIVPLPLIGVWLSLERGILMKNRVTRPITWATASEVVTIAVLFTALGFGVGLVGVTAAFIALLFGKAAAVAWLVPSTRRALDG